MEQKRLLIVDDEAPVREMFEKFLARKGYQVTTAPDALGALRICKRDVPDLVLADYQMPEMNGLELLRELRNTMPDVPVILMSGQVDMRRAIEALREHAFDFLSKPIDSNDLLDTIKRALDRSANVPVPEEIPKDAGKTVGPVVLEHRPSAPKVAVLTLCRPLDQFSQHAFEQAFRRLEEDGDIKQSVVVVMSNVTYINNIGLNILLEAYDRWKSQGKRAIFAQLSEPVHKYLKMLGYIGYFPIAPTIDEAITTVA